MRFENDYKVIYEAPKRVTEEKPGKFYASKTIPNKNDVMLVSYNNGAEYVDLRTFKLIYSDGKHLFGSLVDKPTNDDINIVLKCNDETVFGEVITEEMREEILTQEEPVVEPEPTSVQVAPKRSTRKTQSQVEEKPAEEATVEETVAVDKE